MAKKKKCVEDFPPGWLAGVLLFCSPFCVRRSVSARVGDKGESGGKKKEEAHNCKESRLQVKSFRIRPRKNAIFGSALLRKIFFSLVWCSSIPEKEETSRPFDSVRIMA